MRKAIFIPALCALSIMTVLRCGSDDTTTIQIVDAGTTDSVAPDAVFEPDHRSIHEAGPWGGNFDYGQPGSGPLLYGGGKVLVDPINIYIVWYGKWDNPDLTSLVEDLVSNYANSAYYRTVYPYYQVGDGISPEAGSGGGNLRTNRGLFHPKPGTVITSPNDGGQSYITHSVSFAKSFYDNYSQGSDLFESDITTLIQNAITTNKMIIDPNGIYFVVSSGDVQQNGPDGFCGSYCAFHNEYQNGGVKFKYAFVGYPGLCLDNCSPQDKYLDAGFDHSPNNDWGIDAMVSAFIHELNETISDPEGNSWRDDFGSESMDLTAWTYGPLYITDDNSVANVRIGTHDYLIQQSWMLYPDGGQGPALHP